MAPHVCTVTAVLRAAECAEPRCDGVQMDLAARMASIAALVTSLEGTLATWGAGRTALAPPAALRAPAAGPAAVSFDTFLVQQQQKAKQLRYQYKAMIPTGPGGMQQTFTQMHATTAAPQPQYQQYSAQMHATTAVPQPQYQQYSAQMHVPTAARRQQYQHYSAQMHATTAAPQQLPQQTYGQWLQPAAVSQQQRPQALAQTQPSPYVAVAQKVAMEACQQAAADALADGVGEAATSGIGGILSAMLQL